MTKNPIENLRIVLRAAKRRSDEAEWRIEEVSVALTKLREAIETGAKVRHRESMLVRLQAVDSNLVAMVKAQRTVRTHVATARDLAQSLPIHEGRPQTPFENALQAIAVIVANAGYPKKTLPVPPPQTAVYEEE